MQVNCLYVSINYKLLPVSCEKGESSSLTVMLSTVHISAGSEACIMWWLKEPIAWQRFNQNVHYLLFIWVTKLTINQLKKMLSLFVQSSGCIIITLLFFSVVVQAELHEYSKFLICLSPINTLFLINSLVHCEVLCCSLTVWDTSLYCAHRGKSIGDGSVMQSCLKA